MGITQHAFGGDAVSMVLNLGLARGYVGRDKCGLMPIRGHSSVQGGAEMGAYATAFPGGKTVNASGIAPVGSKLFINGKSVALDGQARFDTSVSPVGGRVIFRLLQGGAEIYTVRTVKSR